MSIQLLALFDFPGSAVGIGSEMGGVCFVMCSRTQATKADFVDIYVPQNSTLGEDRDV
jgi:hypothetical protein